MDDGRMSFTWGLYMWSVSNSMCSVHPLGCLLCGRSLWGFRRTWKMIRAQVKRGGRCSLSSGDDEGEREEEGEDDNDKEEEEDKDNKDKEEEEEEDNDSLSSGDDEGECEEEGDCCRVVQPKY